METDYLNKLIDTLNSTGLEMVKHNLRGFKYQNYEVPYVKKWINKKEQELRATAQNPAKKKHEKPPNKIHAWIKFILHKIPKILYEIIIGIIIFVLGYFVFLAIVNYYHIDLKP
jgi:hypothetical protein